MKELPGQRIIAEDDMSGTKLSEESNAENNIAVAVPVERCVSRHFNQLTPAEAERLAILAEECSEVIQAIGKILRHGYESKHPNGGPTNRESLEREIGDVELAAALLYENDDINRGHVMKRFQEKSVSIMKYMHHAC